MILVSFPVGYSPDEMDYAMVLIVMMMFDDDDDHHDDDHYYVQVFLQTIKITAVLDPMKVHFPNKCS